MVRQPPRSSSNHPQKGRGAIGQPTPRFDHETREPVDDGWDRDEDLPPLRTTVEIDTTKSIITRNDSPDIGFDRSINPYRGCEHGCVYCFARPSHAYLGLSPGLDFETRLFAKPKAAELLAAELSRPGYVCKPIALGTNTDPYQPIERDWKIMRGILEVLHRFRHPVTIVTKGALILRDLDILAPMAAERLARVAVSVTTLDPGLARSLEPRASAPSRRLAAIRDLSAAGIPVSVMAAPMIPGLNDHELEAILEAARDHGAIAAGYTMLRLPHEVKDLFAEWLEAHVPLRARHVLALVRATRSGKLNDSDFSQRMHGTGPYGDLIRRRFALAVARLGLGERENRPDLDISRFRPPSKPGDQLTLF
jgi:DNA repair photolyase